MRLSVMFTCAHAVLLAVLVAGNIVTRAHRQVVREIAAGVDEAV